MATTVRNCISGLFLSALAAVAMGACNGTDQPPPADGPELAQLPAELAGTSWTLVAFQSNDDAIGTVTPEPAQDYVMTLGATGDVSMTLNCNSASGSWSATASSPTSGGFAFGPLAMTRAFCLPPSMDVQIATDAQYVRSYFLSDGQLALDLMADGGTYIWAPAP